MEEFSANHNGQIVIEKTPDHLLHYDQLLEWFPEAKFIVVVRDGRGVANSLRNTPWGKDLESNIRTWRRSALAAKKVLADNNKAMLVRFEDLIKSPQSEIARVMEFLGADFEERQLDLGVSVPNVAGSEKDWKQEAQQDIKINKLDEWKNELSVEERSFLDTYAWDMLYSFGYANLKIKHASGWLRGAAERYLDKQVIIHLKSRKQQIARQRLMANPARILPAEFIGSLRDMTDGYEFPFKHSLTNCGLVAMSDGFFGFFRSGTFHLDCNDIGIPMPRRSSITQERLFKVCLNKDFVVGSVKPVSIVIDGKSFEPGDGLVEDVRAVVVDGRIFGTVSHIPNNDQGAAEVLLFEYFDEPSRLDCFHISGIVLPSPQKNWVPFVWEDSLYIHTDINPFSVYKIDPNVRKVTWEHHGKNDEISRLCGGLRLSGGTPLVSMEDELIGVGHSYTTICGRRDYFSFLYTVKMSGEPRVEKISSAVNLIENCPVQYPIGFVEDHCSDAYVLSFGVADCDNYFVRLSSRQILSEM